MSTIDPGYLGLLLRVFDDMSDKSPEYTGKEAERDRLLVINRCKAEGISFVTKTLPTLAKHFESALASGSFVTPSAFARRRNSNLPRFLGYWFKECFDDQGILRDTASSQSVRYIRQVCYFAYKLELDYPDDVVEECIEAFVNTDAALVEIEQELTVRQRRVLILARSVLGNVFRDFVPTDISPRPGPGASASGTHASKRYEPLTLFSSIHEKYPYYEYFYMSGRHLSDRLREYRAMPRKEYGTSLMRLVPKDSRGPRIICMEEQEYMFLQQGLADRMRMHIEKHPLTRGHVNFRDQTINQRLALESSLSGEYATLDMKEASDRISRELVRVLFGQVPQMRDCLLALATREVKLPSGVVVALKKFAPMGSSLCFPVMSVVHFALAIASVATRTTSTKALAKDIYVYGDDIIVKSEYAPVLFETFPTMGLMFNKNKSFTQGNFRESCGCDAFKGTNVSPLRLKGLFLDSRCPEDLISALEFEYALRRSGYNRTAATLKCMLDSRFGPLPNVIEGSRVLGWLNNATSRDFVRREFMSHSHYRRHTGGYYARALVIKTEPDSSMVGGWEQLMRAHLHTKRSSEHVDGRFSRRHVAFDRVSLSDVLGYTSMKPDLIPSSLYLSAITGRRL